jgi:hypothetical protein
MSGTPYQQGNPIDLEAVFLDGSTPTDPTTVTFKVRAPDGTIASYVFGTDLNVTNPSVGVYICELGAPTDAGQYHYEAVGTGALVATMPGEFYVVPSSVDVPPAPPGPLLGPCRTWIEGEDLVALCGANADTDAQMLDSVAVQSSMLMYELSGRQFAGLCERTVRPCQTQQCGAWPYSWGAGLYSWWGFGAGWGWGWYGPGFAFGANENGPLCGCQPLSRVKLSGYPVREITEVKIDGTVLPALDVNNNPNYRLDDWRYLTRMDDPSTSPPTQQRWPGCQDLALDDTEPGTFSITYQYGVDPPPLGITAAEMFACELFAALMGDDCNLPNNVTKIVRQGLTQERITPLASMLRSGGTGIIAVDAFLAAYNPNGLRRRPAVWSPDVPAYAPRLGST